MERIFTAMVIALGLFAGHANAAGAANVTTKEMYIAVNDVFVPNELKANGDAYVVVSGMFPNSCYSWNRSEVKNVTNSEHEIRVVANVAQTICLMVLSPFNKEIILGRLSSGEHTVRVVSGDGTYFERKMSIP